jgi:anti-sigma B factor antagonist
MGIKTETQPSTLDVTVRNSSCCALISVSGELDMATAPRLTELFDWLSGQPHHQVTIDLHRVSFIDSTGLSVLIQARNTLSAASGRLVLSGPSRSVQRLLDVTGLCHEFALQ